MTTVIDVFKYLDEFAPVRLKMDFDNVGFLLGKADAAVSRILVALDVTDEVIKDTIAAGAQLIVSHHPLLFSVNRITDEDIKGRRLLKLISSDLAVISMHTNLDKTPGGVNDALARTLGLKEIRVLGDIEAGPKTIPCGLGRIGELSDAMPIQDFLASTKKKLNSNGLRYHDAGVPVKKVAVVGGSGGDMIHSAVSAGCDTFVTADVKYDVFLVAKEIGLNLIDGDHFCTENVVVRVLRDRLSAGFPGVEVETSKTHGQTARFL